jgi:hypothetical protein
VNAFDKQMFNMRVLPRLRNECLLVSSEGGIAVLLAESQDKMGSSEEYFIWKYINIFLFYKNYF